MTKKWYWYSGLAAVIVYLVAVVVGGLLYPGYSHISQDISQLTSTHSPIRNLMRIFIVYNLLVIFFGVGLLKISSKVSAKIGSVCIMAIGILGVVIDWFPIDTRGTDLTSTGIVHLIIVSIVSLLTVLSGFLFFRGFRNSNRAIVSKVFLIAGLGFLLSGPVAAVNVLSPHAGLYERIPIGIFLLWICVVSVYLLKQDTGKTIMVSNCPD